MASSTWYVNGVSGSDSNYCQSASTACKTIGRAIDLALSGDSIMVAPATYMVPPNAFQAGITITKNLNVVGAGAKTTIIERGDNDDLEEVVSIPYQSTGPQLVVSLSGITISGIASGSDVPALGLLNYGTLTITESVISGNKGTGLVNAGPLTINKSTISGNGSANNFENNNNSEGGGIGCVSSFFPNAASTSMRINNSTISGNIAPQYGGGIYAAACPTTITNSTITGNSTNRFSGLGGGVFAHATMLINNSTIIANTPGGIDFYPNLTVKVTLQNSIVANNVGGNCGEAGIVISDGYNLSSDDSCNFNGTGDLNNTDPKLGPLQNNGGPSETMALQCMSPAINAGNPTGCTDGHDHLLHTDQRGDKRPGDPALTTGCDMGAYEVQFPK